MRCGAKSGRVNGAVAAAEERVALAAPLLQRAWESSAASSACGQCHEDDVAQVVLVCEADLSNNIMGALHPHGSLYERPVNMAVCARQHAGFREALEAEGAHTLAVREVLLHDVESSLRARVELEDLAAEQLRYHMDGGARSRCFDHIHHAHGVPSSGGADGGGRPTPQGEAPAQHKDSAGAYYVTDQYKQTVLRAMSAEQLVDVVLTGPTVRISPSYRDTGFTATYEFTPVSNLQFTRDQQIVTMRGIVMARLRSEQRIREVNIMRYVHEKLGLPVVGEIQGEDAFLEGGDFFPAGEDLCFIGVGLRSTRAACEELMRKDLLGTRRVAVVRDETDKSQDRMHLDCVFNIASDRVCLLYEGAMGDAPTRRLVDVYERHAPGEGYEITTAGVEFGAFLRGEGYTIVPISAEEQLAYACNILNLGGGCVLSCHEDSARKLARTREFTGNVHYVEFDQITAMYGALHCSSQVLLRTAEDPELVTTGTVTKRRLHLKSGGGRCFSGIGRAARSDSLAA